MEENNWKTCRGCEKTWNETYFTKDSRGKYTDLCRRCKPKHKVSDSHRKAMRKYYNTPRGRYNMLSKRFTQRGETLNLTPDEFLEIWNSTPDECHFCGSSNIDRDNITNKRILNIIRKSTMELIPDMTDGKLVKLCPICNMFRRAALPESVMKKIGEWVKNELNPSTDIW